MSDTPSSLAYLTKPTYSDWIDTQEYRGDKLGEALEWNLSKEIDFTLDDVDWDVVDDIPPWLLELLNKEPEIPTIEDITIRQYGGTGIFDAFMESFHNHLDVEYQNNRITGAEYATTWVQLVSIAIQQAVSFAIERCRLYWDIVGAIVNCWTGLMNLMIAKLQAQVQYVTAKAQLHNLRVQYCLVKLQLATEDANYSNTMESVEQTRAQTQDSRLSDGRTVVGYVGKQKDLLTQQIASFKRNDEVKHLEQLVNIWIAEKTVDEGILVPEAAQNSLISSALESARDNLGI